MIYPWCTSPMPPQRSLTQKGHRKIGLLGTAFTMEQDFYKGRLQDKYGLDVLTPGPEDRKIGAPGDL